MALQAPRQSDQGVEHELLLEQSPEQNPDPQPPAAPRRTQAHVKRHAGGAERRAGPFAARDWGEELGHPGRQLLQRLAPHHAQRHALGAVVLAARRGNWRERSSFAAVCEQPAVRVQRGLRAGTWEWPRWHTSPPPPSASPHNAQRATHTPQLTISTPPSQVFRRLNISPIVLDDLSTRLHARRTRQLKQALAVAPRKLAVGVPLTGGVAAQLAAARRVALQHAWGAKCGRRRGVCESSARLTLARHNGIPYPSPNAQPQSLQGVSLLYYTALLAASAASPTHAQSKVAV